MKSEHLLEKLGLLTAKAHLPKTAQQAAASGMAPSQFLEALLTPEVEARYAKTVALSLKFARFPVIKKLADFDFSLAPSIPKALVDELDTGGFLDEGRNIILLGPPGVGKTHLAIALGVRACELERRAMFLTISDMSKRLKKAQAANQLHREMRTLMHPKLLILDEMGYLPLETWEASLLFQVISERYQHGGSIIITSNKSFSQWGEVFAGDTVMATAALDRLLHKSTVLNIKGQSYRTRGRKAKDGQIEDLMPNSSKDAKKTSEK